MDRRPESYYKTVRNAAELYRRAAPQADNQKDSDHHGQSAGDPQDDQGQAKSFHRVTSVVQDRYCSLSWALRADAACTLANAAG